MRNLPMLMLEVSCICFNSRVPASVMVGWMSKWDRWKRSWRLGWMMFKLEECRSLVTNWTLAFGLDWEQKCRSVLLSNSAGPKNSQSDCVQFCPAHNAPPARLYVCDDVVRWGIRDNSFKCFFSFCFSMSCLGPGSRFGCGLDSWNPLSILVWVVHLAGWGSPYIVHGPEA